MFTFPLFIFCNFQISNFDISPFSYFPRQGVHKGKINSPGVSPRASGGEENSREGGEDDEEEEEGGASSGVRPGDVMKLQLEILEGEPIL